MMVDCDGTTLARSRTMTGSPLDGYVMVRNCIMTRMRSYRSAVANVINLSRNVKLIM